MKLSQLKPNDVVQLDCYKSRYTVRIGAIRRNAILSCSYRENVATGIGDAMFGIFNNPTNISRPKQQSL